MDTSGVKKTIGGIYQRRAAAVYAICLKWAGIALNYFRQVQPARPNSPGKFWHNRTAQAAQRFISSADRTSFSRFEVDVIRWFVAHGVGWGVYLELANDRRHEALRPIIQRFAGRMLEEVRQLYAD